MARAEEKRIQRHKERQYEESTITETHKSMDQMDVRRICAIVNGAQHKTALAPTTYNDLEENLIQANWYFQNFAGFRFQGVLGCSMVI